MSPSLSILLGDRTHRMLADSPPTIAVIDDLEALLAEWELTGPAGPATVVLRGFDATTHQMHVLRRRSVSTAGHQRWLLVLIPQTGEAARDRRLAEAERRFTMLAENAGDGVLLHDGQRVLYANRRACEIVGASHTADIIGVAISTFIRPDDRPALDDLRRRLSRDRDANGELPLRLRRLQGDIVPVHATIGLVDWSGIAAVQVILRDERAGAPTTPHEAVRHELERAVRDAIICTDGRFRVESWNQGATELYGWTAEQAIGRRIEDVVGDAQPGHDRPAAIDALFATGHWQGSVLHRHRDGHTLPIEVVTSVLRDQQGEVAGIVLVNRLAADATGPMTRDELTGLASRPAMMAALAHTPRTDTSVVVLLDLDHFSEINARLGHDAGDAVLIELATRFSEAVRADDVLARVGADRFALLGRVSDGAEAKALAGRLERLVNEPMDLDGTLVAVSASLGAAWGPARDGADRLYEQAERALREAESKGGRRLCFYDPTTEAGGWHDDASFSADVHRAIQDGDLTVAYQPIVELSSGRLRKIEALSRWTHPERGVVPPVQFIPLAERSGAIHELGEWVLRTACTEVMSIARSADDIGLTVNLSAAQLRDPLLPRRVAAVLADTGMPPERLWLEVTEGTLVDDDALPPLRALHQLGVHLVIDDFGTGYATLQYLTRLPIDAVKIDRSFISGLGVDGSDTAIVRSVVNLGRELGLQVIAEGVETESQRAQLIALSCRLAQGWLFGHAVPIRELAALHRNLDSVQIARPAPMPANESSRIAALEACRVLDSAAEVAFDRLVELAAKLLDSPMALVSLVDSDRQWFKARVGVELQETERDIAFCAHAIVHPEKPFVVPDARLDARFSANPLVVGEPHIRFYAGAAIYSREHLPLGTLCVLDDVPRQLTDDQAELLTMLAEQAAALLDSRRRSLELTELLHAHQPIDVPGGLPGDQPTPWGTLVEWTSDVVLVLGADATIRYANPAARSMLGHEPSEWLGRSGLDLVHPDDLADAIRALEETATTPGAHIPHQLRAAHADGSWLNVELVANSLLGVPGIDAILVTVRDVSDRHAALEQVARQREFIESTLDNLSDGVVACDEFGVMTVFNLGARRLHDLPGRPVHASTWAEIYDLLTIDGRRRLTMDELPLYRALQGERVEDVEILIAPPRRPPRIVRCNGQQLRDPSGKIIGAVVAMQDVTSQREVESLLRHQALHDQLTGLANRHQLVPFLDQALRTDPARVSVAFVDLDRLKLINDTYGHPAGDALLTQMAQRLAASCRDDDMVARIGGDEFALVRVAASEPSVAADQDWLERLRVASTFTLDLRPYVDGRAETFDARASCGLVRGQAGDTASAVLSRADEAMYEVKLQHRSHLDERLG